MAVPPPYKLLERCPRAQRVPVPDEIVEQIRAHCGNARYLDAWKCAESAGPLWKWAGSSARLTGARLAVRTGGHRLSDLLDVSGYREARHDPKAQVAYGRYLLSSRSPIDAWRFLRSLDLEPHPPRARARLLGLRAATCIHLRDFESAEKLLRSARELFPQEAWDEVQLADLFAAQDRHEEALEASQRALAVHPWYEPALTRAVTAWLNLNREGEAVDLLREAMGRLQSAHLAGRLVGILREQEDFAGMLKPLEQFEEWSPLMEPQGYRWLCGSRAEAHYHCGQVEEAIFWAERSGTDYHIAFAERLRRTDSPRKRVRLEVGFVRQHHNTCAPATLAALASFQGLPVLQREIVEEICYDGTYDLHERRWAEDSGCYVREFRVTWEATKALIDARIPFAMVTTTPGTAHLQAVIGYDEMRATLLIREPSDREYEEFIQDAFFSSYAAVGPRGMAFVPDERRSVLESIELPEATLYDACFALNSALEEHDREKAVTILQSMEKEAPDSRMAILCRRTLAEYDRNVPEQLAANTALLALFPDDERIVLTRVFCLRELSLRDERIELLSRLCARRDVHPTLLREYATDLAEDERNSGWAIRLLERAHRRGPSYASITAKLADLHWDRRNLDLALELYRFAFCQDDKNERLARSYFIACRHFRRTDVALELLRRRFEALGSKSDGPARTLFQALEDLNRSHDGFEILEEAIRKRPTDGTLKIYAADQFARYNHTARSAELLASAEKTSRRATWLRVSGRLAANRGAHAEALGLWREVIALEPLAEDAHEEVAELLALTHGVANALQHLREICEQYPHHFELNRIWLRWLRRESDEAAEPVARHIVRAHPNHAWARREFATILAMLGRVEEALEEARVGRDLEPRATYAYNVLGDIKARQGDLAAAREYYREAIRLEVDNGYAIDQLIPLARNAAERRSELALFRAELKRQVIFGDALATYRRVAEGILTNDELAADLEEALEARPDLWSAWAALTNHRASMGELDIALAKAREITQRFPLVAGSWQMLGHIHELRHDWSAAVEAYGRAIEIAPSCTSYICDLADNLERAGDRSRARRTLENALARRPLDERLHGYLGDLLLRAGEKDAALTHFRRAVELEPGYGWAWDSLKATGGKEEVLSMVRELTRTRAGEARSWLLLAQNLTNETQFEECMHALDEAIKRNPQCIDAWDLKAFRLCGQKRYDEAIAACEPPVWSGHLPLTLRGRRAWIEADRGNRKEAISMMRAVLADQENYFWAWNQLADWLEAEEDLPGLLEAAKQMVRWRPKYSVAHGYLGDVLRKMGDRSAAMAELTVALQFDPTYNFAGWSLFDLHMEDGDADAAEKALQMMAESAVERILAAEVKIALHRRDFEAARQRFEALATYDSPNPGAFYGLTEAFESAKALATLDSILEGVLERCTLNSPAAGMWVTRQLAKRRWNLLPSIERLLRSEAASSQVVLSIAQAIARKWFECAGDSKVKIPRLRRVIRDHREWLSKDVQAWGMLGYALRAVGDNKTLVRWMSDWREQEKRPWMLCNLNTSLRLLGKMDEAQAVTAHGTALGGEDRFAYELKVHHALDRALNGAEHDEVNALIEPASADAPEWVKYIARLAAATVAVRSAVPAERLSVFRAQLKEIRAAGKYIACLDAAQFAATRGALNVMASEAGVPLPWRYALGTAVRYFWQRLL